MTVSTEQPAPARPKTRMLRDVLLIVMARIGGALSAVFFTMLLSRSMGAEGLGEVAAAVSLAMLLALACTSNIEAGGVRFIVKDIAGGHFDKVEGFIWFTRRYVLVLSLLVLAVALGLMIWRKGGVLPDLPVLLALCAAPFMGGMRLGGGLAMGFSSPLLAVLPRTLFRPLVLMGAVALWVTLIGTPTPTIVMGLFLLTLLAVLVLQNLLLRGHIQAMRQRASGQSRSLSDWKDWVRIGLTMGLNVLFIEYSVYVAVLSASFVLPNDQLALLDVTLKIMALLKFGLTAVNQAFMPKLSGAMAQNNQKALLRWLALSGLMKVVALCCGGLVVIVLGQWALGLFGAEFVAAYPILLLVMLDPVCVALFGPGSNVVSFSKRPAALLPALAMSLLTLVGGCVLLGGSFGLLGVGIAVVAARFVWSAWLAIYAIFVLGINPTLWSVPQWLMTRKTG